MLLRFGATIALLGCSAFAQSWKPDGACLTPNGTLCRTLVYQSSGWTNRSWGFHAIERYDDRITEAVRSDGAAMLRKAHSGHRYGIIPAGSYDRSRIILPKKQQTFEVERTLNQFRELGGVWFFYDFWRDEPDCRATATSAGPKWRKTGVEPVLAGIRGVEYLWEAPEFHVRQKIAFAPALGCTAIEFSLSRKNAAGLPISETHLKLVSATIGEPDGALFALPGGIHPAPFDARWDYVWMNSFPGHITMTSFSLVVP